MKTFADKLLQVCLHLDEAAVLVDAERRITSFNPAAEILFGYRTDEVVGQTQRMLFADKTEFERQRKLSFGRKVTPHTNTYRARYRRRDGVEFHGDTSGGPIVDDARGLIGFMEIVRPTSQAAEAVDFLVEFNRAANDYALPLDRRIDRILGIGARFFDMPWGIQTRFEGDRFGVERFNSNCVAWVERRRRYPIAESFHGRVRASIAPFGRLYFDDERMTHPCLPSKALRSVLCCPLVEDGVVTGTLDFFSTERVRPFTNEDLAFVQLLGTWIGSAVGEERRSAELRLQATRDSLTGLPNRAAVFNELEKQIAAADRKGRALTIGICDIDHFKAINDEHGHPAGDEVLCRFSEAIREQLRRSDTGGRWGGEEFLFVLPDTDEAGAQQVCARFLAHAHAMQIALDEGTSIGVTASIGVAQWHPDERAQDLITRADRALYHAKAMGRARVCQESELNSA